MGNKSIIIIGAGMGGLAAGIYGRMNGYDTRIFEMHTKAGGQCAAWHRKGYTFDASKKGDPNKGTRRKFLTGMLGRPRYISETRPSGSDALHSRSTRKRWVQAVRNASPSDSVACLKFPHG